MNATTVKYTRFGIIALCVIAFLPVLSAGFVNYDDPEYIVDNFYLKKFSFQNIAAIFSGKSTVLYVPLTIFSYLLEYTVFGENARVFHTVNLLLHVLNGLMLLRILLQLKVANHYLVYGVLLFFTLNPLVTESVCWVTERKDVLYCFFFFLAASRFLAYFETGKPKDIFLCGLHFVLACLSKPMAVTLPALMALYIIYRNRALLRQFIPVLIPFFAGSALFAWLAFHNVHSSEPQKILNLNYTFFDRGLVFMAELGFYFFKPFLPVQQHLFYLFPVRGHFFENLGFIAFLLGGAGVIALIVYAALKKHKTTLYLFAAWLVVLSPVLQLDSNNHSYVNERYFYVAIIFPAGLLFLWLSRFALRENALRSGFIIVLLCFVALTYTRSRLWRETSVLMEHELKEDPKNPMIMNNLGYHYNSISDFTRARALLQQAITLDPDHPFYLNNYGWALSGLNQTDSAIVYFNKALDKKPNFVVALNNLGICYAQKKDMDNAYYYFVQAFDLDKNNDETLYYLGMYYKNTGRSREASPYFKRAYELGNKQAAKYLGL